MKDLFNKIIKNDQAMSLIRIISVATLLHMYKSSGHNTIEQIVFVLTILVLMLACSDYE